MPENYWTVAKSIVDWWAQYNAAKKLYYNATHEETRHKVQHVVQKHYFGNPDRIKSREKDLSFCVDACLDRFEMICEDLKIEPVTRDWLYHHLKASKDYQSLRGKIDRRQKNGVEPVSLKTLV